jgi:adenosylmethionine---8-amino-7-oxononanoate aminotransferase
VSLTGARSAPRWQREGYPHIWMPYTQMKTEPLPLPVVGTHGVRIRLADGRELIDGIASWWSACHGFNHPHLVEAIERQLRAMPHVMFGGLNHEPALTLARRLAERLPGDLSRVFFSDSGSVAVEVALKMAVQYWRNRGERGRDRFICFRHGYHGDTLGAMSVTDPLGGMHAHFKGYLLEHFPSAVPTDAAGFDELDRLMARCRDRAAGVILEPLVQGAGGYKFHPPGSVAEVRRLCDRHGLLLILDEIATGFGRTGTMFACEQAGVVPDVIALGKALTGGVIGLAATVARDHVFDAFWSDDPAHALMHGPTYMANPLACAAANASLDLFDTEPRLAQAAAIEAHLRDALAPCRGLPHVVDVRVKGAVGVIQVDELRDRDWLRSRFVEEGVWIRPFRDTVYVTPSLAMPPDDLARLTDAMVGVTREWSARG